MHVSQVNKTNFNGRFQKTPALEQILKHSNTKDLGQFSEIVERARNVNDEFLYSIQNTINTNYKSFDLYRRNLKNNRTTLLCGITMTNFNESLKLPSALGNFVAYLRDIYPPKYNNSKEEIIETITKNLV